MADSNTRGYTSREDCYYPQVKAGQHDPDSCFVIVAARFNPAVVEGLLEGAERVLREHGVPREQVQVWRVPGAFELPLMARYAARCYMTPKEKPYGVDGRCDAVIALGAIIRGKTPHFEYVSQTCIQGLMRVSLKEGLPVACGVLTANTQKQALARAGKRLNRGAEAAESALAMAALLPYRGRFSEPYKHGSRPELFDGRGELIP